MAKIFVAAFDDCRQSICPLLFTFDIHFAGCPKQSDKIKFYFRKVPLLESYQIVQDYLSNHLLSDADNYAII
jgi:hypothetical protein